VFGQFWVYKLAPAAPELKTTAARVCGAELRAIWSSGELLFVFLNRMFDSFVQCYPEENHYNDFTIVFHRRKNSSVVLGFWDLCPLILNACLETCISTHGSSPFSVMIGTFARPGFFLHVSGCAYSLQVFSITNRMDRTRHACCKVFWPGWSAPV
jgi:hypothetical protein